MAKDVIFGPKYGYVKKWLFLFDIGSECFQTYLKTQIFFQQFELKNSEFKNSENSKNPVPVTGIPVTFFTMNSVPVPFR